MQRGVNAAIVCSIAFFANAFVGCAAWTERGEPTRDTSPLKPIAEDRRVPILEFEFVPIVIGHTAQTQPSDPEVPAESWATSPQSVNSTSVRSTDSFIQSLWQWVDETGVDPDLRGRLFENGMRIGRLLQPERFYQRLDTMKPQLDRVDRFLQQAAVTSDAEQGGKRVPMRNGRRLELPVRQPLVGMHVTLVRIEGKTIGQTLESPQFQFGVTATELASPGKILVRMRPEVLHGSLKQTWVGNNSALRINTKRDAWSWEALELEFRGREGDVFVISSLPESRGLGKQMFASQLTDGTPQETILLVKIVHVPSSVDRFSSAEIP